MTEYQAFLNRKAITHSAVGFDCRNLHKSLFDFQKFTVRRALKLGRSAAYLDCGMGKTFIQLEFADKVAVREKKPVLVLTPLAVCLPPVLTRSRGGRNGAGSNPPRYRVARSRLSAGSYTGSPT